MRHAYLVKEFDEHGIPITRIVQIDNGGMVIKDAHGTLEACEKPRVLIGKRRGKAHFIRSGFAIAWWIEIRTDRRNYVFLCKGEGEAKAIKRWADKRTV